MGATVVGDTIYVDKDLAGKLTQGEYRVLLAHELGHYYGKHRFILLPLIIFFFWCPSIVNAIKRHLEIRADQYALRKTKDYASFVSLMDKLKHDKTSHPSKEARLLLAQRG